MLEVRSGDWLGGAGGGYGGSSPRETGQGWAPDTVAVFAIGRPTLQHRYLDCGTLISERSLRSRHPMPYRWWAVAGKEPPMAGACMAGKVLG